MPDFQEAFAGMTEDMSHVDPSTLAESSEDTGEATPDATAAKADASQVQVTPTSSKGAPQGHVPYSRFSEAIRERNELRQKLVEFEQRQSSNQTQTKPKDDVDQLLRDILGEDGDSDNKLPPEYQQKLAGIESVVERMAVREAAQDLKAEIEEAISTTDGYVSFEEVRQLVKQRPDLSAAQIASAIKTHKEEVENAAFTRYGMTRPTKQGQVQRIESPTKGMPSQPRSARGGTTQINDIDKPRPVKTWEDAWDGMAADMAAQR